MPQTAAQTLVDALPLPAVLIGSDDWILAANTAARALLGPNAAGRHYITVLRQPELLDAIERSQKTGGAVGANYLTRDGEGRDLTYRATCAWLAVGPLEGVLVSLEDLTHLEQAGQMRRDFIANVSHELRTPLTSLLGFIETLRGPAKDDPAARERFLAIMAAEAQRMERLVSDLLSLSRVEAQERERPTGSVDLAALCRSVTANLAPVARESGVEIATSLPETLPIRGDEDQLRQVLANLLENAIKYGGAGGRVSLTLTASEREPALRLPAARIEVRDSGAGIDPLHIPRLTERFYRIDSHRSRQVGGTGLGLAIVKHIVGRHRGRLRIESTPGEGSTFTVLLPAEG